MLHWHKVHGNEVAPWGFTVLSHTFSLSKNRPGPVPTLMV
jgi:hypothetical protein